MPYPSTISTLPNPLPTDRLNSPSHSALHTSENTAIVEIETFVGTLSSVAGSLSYDIRSPLSNGGGHVQTAVKGGTGQTTYTKGDTLVAQSASVLGKLAVGLDGQSLVADSSVVSGVKWGTPGGIKIRAVASSISVPGGTAVETSIITTTIPGSTLGTSNAIKAVAYVREFNFSNGSSVLVRGLYGGGNVASVMVRPIANISASIAGTISFTLIANATATAQRGILQVFTTNQQSNPSAVTSLISISLYNSNTSSVNSSANQTMGVTVRDSGGGSDNILQVDGSIIEKIA